MSGSFLGKKPNKPATEIVQDIARFHELLMSESFSAVNILVIPTAKRDFVDTQNNTHLVVPCGLDLNYIGMFWTSYKKESAILTQI